MEKSMAHPRKSAFLSTQSSYPYFEGSSRHPNLWAEYKHLIHEYPPNFSWSNQYSRC